MNLSNYPPGLSDNTPGAPWNEPVIHEKDFEVTCSQSLSRTATVTTNNYIPRCDEGCEDGIGYHDEWADTSDTNWADEYESNGYKTPLELIGMLREYLEKDLRDIQRDMLPNDRSFKATKARMLKGLIEECEAWTEDEIDFEEG
jgi:hypothetical protein